MAEKAKARKSAKTKSRRAAGKRDLVKGKNATMFAKRSANLHRGRLVPKLLLNPCVVATSAAHRYTELLARLSYGSDLVRIATACGAVWASDGVLPAVWSHTGVVGATLGGASSAI